LSKAKIATALLVALGLVVAGASALTRQALAAPPEEAKPQDGANPPAVKPAPAGEKAAAVEVRGRVLDPDGKPVPGAKLVFVYASGEKAPDKIWATSAAGGAFQFSVARGIEDAAWYGNAWDQTYVVAAAEGHGFAWARVRPGASGDLTLRLVKDDVPLRGRVLDLQGKPVAGATVRIEDLPSEPVLLSFVVAASMVIDLPERQGLLDEPDTVCRLSAERALLVRETAMLRATTSRPAPDLRYTPYSPN